MRRLEGAPELLDGPLDEQLLAGNLRDLGRINRWLGGARLSLDAIVPLARQQAVVRVLDVGTGAADIPAYISRAMGSKPPKMYITAIDIRPEICRFAAQNVARHEAVQVKQGRLEDEPADGYEFVHASLVLHHLDPVAAEAFVADMARVAREAVVINDLDRGWRWWTGAWLMTRLLTRNEYTRHDAPLSVRRAYTADEVVALAGQAGLRLVAHYRTRPAYRYALVFVHDRPHSG